MNPYPIFIAVNFSFLGFRVAEVESNSEGKNYLENHFEHCLEINLDILYAKKSQKAWFLGNVSK